MLGRGYELRIYDPSLNLSRLIGENGAEIQRRMPHLASLLKEDVREVVEGSELVIVSQKCAKIDELATMVKAEQSVIDVNGWRELSTLPWAYEGLCW